MQTGYLARDGVEIRDFHYRIVKGYRKRPGND
jgi:hypothetical protein